jgi:2-methylcitrate dehydratase PrpD
MSNERAATAAGIAALVDWAHGVRYADIPPAVLARMVRIIADDLGAMVGARDEHEVAAFHARTLSRPGVGESTVFRGGRQRTDRRSAAVANGVAIDWLELDEGYRKAVCHGGLCTLPALLAEAEAVNAPLHEVLRAAVVAYDMVTRLARAWTPIDIVHHAHGRYAAVGAAAAVALLRGVGRDVLQDAYTGAMTLTTTGPRNHAVEGALIRNTWPAVGAWSGMMSVEWAQCGIGGIAQSAFDVYSGLLHGTAQADILTNDLGRAWAVMDGYTKVHACCQQTHSAAEAAIALRERLRTEAKGARIEAIRVETHHLAMPLNNLFPPTGLAGKFSLPHVVAAVLEHGEAGVAAFSRDAIESPSIAALREKVTIAAFTPALDPPNDRPARISVALSDGRSITEVCLSAPGGPDRPFGDDVVWNKVRRLAGPVYPRLADTLADVARLEPARLARGWADVVAELCAT